MCIQEKTVFPETDNFMTIRHLTIRGTNFDIGKKLGKLMIERHGKSAAQYRSNPVLTGAQHAYIQQNYPILWERIRGVAEAFGIDENDEQHDFSKLIYNLNLPLQAPGCSAAYYPPSVNSDKCGYLSRNYDFSIGSLAELMELKVPPETNKKVSSIMSEPYIMEWYPEDSGYASIAIQAFDSLSGTLDGMNSAGLVVSILADEDAMDELGENNLELHLGALKAIGLHELQIMRLLLDTCATIVEAKKVLLTIKQYYFLIPCHYIIADKTGDSFIYENSTGRNIQHVIEGNGKPQVITNFQVNRHPTREQMPGGKLNMENNAYWRYQTLEDLATQSDTLFTPDDLKYNNASVSVAKMTKVLSGDPVTRSIAASGLTRTLWHSLYNSQTGTVEFCFYLNEKKGSDGLRIEQHSDYVKFELST